MGDLEDQMPPRYLQEHDPFKLSSTVNNERDLISNVVPDYTRIEWFA